MGIRTKGGGVPVLGPQPTKKTNAIKKIMFFMFAPFLFKPLIQVYRIAIRED